VCNQFDSVIPAHSFKFTATLQNAQNCNNPLLVRIESKADHRSEKLTGKIIEEQADKWSFMLWNMGLKYEWKALLINKKASSCQDDAFLYSSFCFLDAAASKHYLDKFRLHSDFYYLRNGTLNILPVSYIS
jgi:hypothetical protein